MVKTQIQARGISDPGVLRAMGTLPRHLFVDPSLASRAYDDHPLPIGLGQTISQPYIVALMAEALELEGTEKVLEVGSGCGYMAAVLSHLAAKVLGMDLEADLLRRARETLADLGISNATLREGDGSLGWPEEAPFDAILLSCAADRVPPALWGQLAEKGRMLLPLAVKAGHQELVLIRKTPSGPITRSLLPVVFVPLR